MNIQICQEKSPKIFRQIADLFAVGEEVQQDNFDVDKATEFEPFAKNGDVWHIGRHTVICGDSTLPETYTALLGDKK